MPLALRTVTASGALTSSDYCVLADASAGNIVLTLPPVAGLSGDSIMLKKTDSSANTVSLVVADAAPVIGDPVLVSPNDRCVFVTDGTTWHIVQRMTAGQYATAAQGALAATALQSGSTMNASNISSGTFDPARLGTDPTAGKYLRGDGTWQTLASGGDMLAANNLSDVLLPSIARTNLGLGTAATTAATAYATAAQGATADLAAVDTVVVAALATKAPLTHSHAPADITGTAVVTADSRLSDARTPTAHNQAWSTITATPTTLSGYGITDGVANTITVNGQALSGNVTVTTISGNAGTVTDIGNLTGVVTSTNRATSIANGAITNAMLANGAVANLTGTNSGDQSTIVGITGTLAEFNTALTGADFATGGGTATGANTGDNSANSLYSGLVSNATHTGDVTGSTTLTLATAQPDVHTWSLAQTFTVPPVFTDASGSRTALGLGTLATQSGTFSGTSSGTNTGDQTSVTGNAGTVTTNANLTGPVTSTGNATAIASGAISNAMLANAAVANLSGTNTGDQTLPTAGTITGATLAANVLASSLTSVGTLTGGATGAGFTIALSTSTVTGTLPDARFPATLPALSGINLTALNASNIASGTVGADRLGSAGGAGKYLRYDNTWQTLAGGGDALVASTLDQFADVTQTAGQTLAITSSTTLAGGTHSGTNTGDQSTAINAGSSSYDTILSVAGSHIAARVAGTYAVPFGSALAVSGTGTLYPIGLIHIVAADYPTVNGLAAKLRIRAQIECNDVAPTGNYTVGLYPVTRPATSGGAGLVIYTLGTVVSGSNGATVSAPAADSNNLLVGADFALPADGLYCIGVVTTATVATSAHVHICAQLQKHNL